MAVVISDYLYSFTIRWAANKLDTIPLRTHWSIDPVLPSSVIYVLRAP